MTIWAGRCDSAVGN